MRSYEYQLFVHKYTHAYLFLCTKRGISTGPHCCFFFFKHFCRGSLEEVPNLLAPWLVRGSFQPHVTVAFFFLSCHLFHPLLCPPVIPPLPFLTYVTCPHPRAFGLGAEIDRLSSMVTTACGLCVRKGSRKREREGV